jgi:hypothetical protein
VWNNAENTRAAFVRENRADGLDFFGAVPTTSHASIDGVCREARARYGGVVRLGGPNALFCSGVLISEKVILTAAHCVDGAGGEITTMAHTQRQGSRQTPCITIGSRPENRGQCVARRFDIVIHPSYRPGNPQNDIAILHLKNNRLRFRNGDRIPKSYFARLYADVWHRSREQLVAGFGPCNPSGAGWGEYRHTRIRVVSHPMV